MFGRDRSRMMEQGEESLEAGGAARPEALRGAAEERVVDLDVRDDLRRGEEPFPRIMQARSGMSADGILRVRALFEPLPLYGVMAGHGLELWTEELAPDDWRVRFYDPDATSESAEETDPVVLDVRPIPPRAKHATIFKVFGALEAGRFFVLVNDHDPRPLRYQFEAERAGKFKWEYLEEGPEVWRVKISRV